MTAFYKLPVELLLEVAEDLEVFDLLSFLTTCRWVYSVVDLVFHRKAVERMPYLLPWACETGRVRMVEKMLISGVDPNIPHRLRHPRGTHASKYFYSAARPNWYRDRSLGLDINLEDPFRLLELVYEPTLSVHNFITDCYDKNAPFFNVFTGIDDNLAGVYAAFDDEVNEFLDDLTTMSLDPLLTYDPQKPQHYSPARSYWFPLHAAAKAGCNEIIELLVKHGSYLDLPSKSLCCCPERNLDDKFGQTRAMLRRGLPRWTPLHTALCSGNEATAKLLISLGASLSVDLHDSQLTVWHSAASRGCISTIQYLVDTKRLFDANAKDRYGWSPLAYTRNRLRQLGSNELASQTRLWLLDRGADLNTSLGYRNCTVLHLACYEGRYRDAIRLIESGANVHAAWKYNFDDFDDLDHWYDGNGLVPIDLACSRIAVKKFLRGEDPCKTHSLIDDSIEEGRLELVKKLIEEGAAAEVPKPVPEDRFQPLIFASISHLVPVMDLLVAAGANVCMETDFGVFPLLGALHSSCYPFASGSTRDDLQWDTVIWLLDHGADPNQESSRPNFISPTLAYRGPPLMVLLEDEPDFEDSHRMKLVELLLDRGANPNYRDKDGLTPLKEAINHDRYDVARCLLQRGAENPVASQDLLDMLEFIVCEDKIKEKTKVLQRRLDFILEIDTNRTLFKDPRALEIATGARNLPLVEILLDKGTSGWGDQSLRSSLCSALCSALQGCNRQRTAVLAQRLSSLGVDGELEQCLHEAIANQAWDIAKVLLHHRVQFKLDEYRKYDAYFDMPTLALAMHYPRADTDDMISWILSANDLSKDPTAYEGYLQLACGAALPRTIATLVNAGVDVDSEYQDQTPIVLFLRQFNDDGMYDVNPYRIKPKSFVDVFKILTSGREYLNDDALRWLQGLIEYSGRDERKRAIKDQLSRHFMIGYDPESSKLRIRPRDANKK